MDSPLETQDKYFANLLFLKRSGYRVFEIYLNDAGDDPQQPELGLTAILEKDGVFRLFLYGQLHGQIYTESEIIQILYS